MLDALHRNATIGEAVPEIAEVYGQPEAVIERDLLEFCDDLLARGLVVAE
jgi:hypothetical protein